MYSFILFFNGHKLVQVYMSSLGPIYLNVFNFELVKLKTQFFNRTLHRKLPFFSIFYKRFNKMAASCTMCYNTRTLKSKRTLFSVQYRFVFLNVCFLYHCQHFAMTVLCIYLFFIDLNSPEPIGRGSAVSVHRLTSDLIEIKSLVK